MRTIRALVLVAAAFALLAGFAPAARADAAPWPLRVKRPVPPDPQPPQGPDEMRVRDEALVRNPKTGEWEPLKERRTGPFRSCGSGMGTGLVGIGAAWAALWLGFRLTGRGRGANRPAR